VEYTAFHPVVKAAGVLEKKLHREKKAEETFRLWYVSSGEVSFCPENGKSVKLSSGSYVLIPRGVPYSLRAGMCRTVTVAFDGIDKEAPFDVPFYGNTFEEEEKLLAVVDVFASETKTSGAYASALLCEILLSFADEREEDALPLRLVRKLDAYIAENRDADIPNTELAAVFGYHPFYLSQLMKSKTGLTLRQYVAAYRFRLAKTLLENTDASVSDIAMQLGFSDASYFTKCFKKEVGLTPKEYRNSKQDGEC